MDREQDYPVTGYLVQPDQLRELPKTGLFTFTLSGLPCCQFFRLEAFPLLPLLSHPLLLLFPLLQCHQLLLEQLGLVGGWRCRRSRRRGRWYGLKELNLALVGRRAFLLVLLGRHATNRK